MKTKYFLSVCILLFSKGINAQEYKVQKHTDANGYSFETVTNDPVGLRLYTLKNGMTVYLARNTDASRVLYATAVRAGSKYDPADNTGLAHYLEHLLFNGSDKVGALNWKKEEQLLKEIENLFEEHKKENNQNKKKEIFTLIDSLSQEASHYGLKGEYRKLATAIGAAGINGTTNFEYVVFGSLVPANSLKKFLELEKERFGHPSFRAFHTELEIVYEEFNSRQDNKFLIKYEAANKVLFPTHPYGTQNAIGKSEHLKNPSITAVKSYYDRFFVPNNMAVVIVGDIDFIKTIQWVQNTFGALQPKPVDRKVYSKENPIISPVEIELSSSHRSSVLLSFRMNGIGSDDVKYMTIVDRILQNSVAGMLTLELKNKGKLKEASSFGFFTNNDYSVHYLDGHPKEGQTLEGVKAELLSVLEKIKKGDFEEWLILASARDIKREFIKEITTNNLETWAARSFTQFRSWAEQLSFIDELQKITKQELMTFAERVYQNNYVVVYKRQGVTTDLIKVEKPAITPIQLNDDKASVFGTRFLQVKPKATEPVFTDYKKVISQSKLKNGVPVSFVRNTKNDLFEIDLVFDMGKNNDKKIPLAVNYLDVIGTDKYPPGEWKKEFFKLGLSFRITARNAQTIFHIEGLQESLPAGIQLFDHLFSAVKPDKAAYDRYIESIINIRKSSASNKNSIRQALYSYILYDGQSPARDVFTEEELKNTKPEELTRLLNDIRKYEHQIFYYGNDLATALNAFTNYYKAPQVLQKVPQPKLFEMKKTNPIVYFVNYESSQSDVMVVTRGEKFDKKVMALSNMFNRFIEKASFQLIREARSLAYSNWAVHNISTDSNGYNNMEIYAATQNDKVVEALQVMTGLMKDISTLEAVFKEAKEDQLNRYRNERITGPAILWTKEEFKKSGINHDYRRDMYEAIQKMIFDDMKSFFANNIAKNGFAILLVGNKKDIEMKSLTQYGEIKEINADYLFNYK